MIDTMKYIKLGALALLLAGIAWATVQSGGIKGLSGNMIVSFNQDKTADDLSAIATAAGE